MKFCGILILLILQSPLLNAESCGQRSAKRASSRIVGGSQAAPNKWPWAAAIYKQNRFTCGGAVVNSRYIVSAAHCFVGGGVGASGYKVLLGAHDLRNGGTTYDVESITVPRAYKTSGHYDDIALVKTKNAIAFNSKVSPICLPSGDMGKLEGKNTAVVGWGTTNEGGSPTTVLRELHMPVVDRKKCDSQYRKLRLQGVERGITDSQICAGTFSGGKDSCQGDSGGPLMMPSGSTWTLIGVVSFGQGCARKGYPGVYTRVDRYTNWIGTNSRSSKRKSKTGKQSSKKG